MGSHLLSKASINKNKESQSDFLLISSKIWTFCEP